VLADDRLVANSGHAVIGHDLEVMKLRPGYVTVAWRRILTRPLLRRRPRQLRMLGQTDGTALWGPCWHIRGVPIPPRRGGAAERVTQKSDDRSQTTQAT
jgi:hypothetical protein